MKIKVFPLLLSIILTAALSYYSYDVANNREDANALAIGIGMAVMAFLTLSCVMGVSLVHSKMNVNLKAWGLAAFIVVAVTNLCFAFMGVSMPIYILVQAFLLVVHLWVVWKLTTIVDV